MGRADALCWWTVAAGFAQGETAERLAKTLAVTVDEWRDGDLAGRRLRAARQQEAVSYASTLMSDELVGWVTLEYVSDDSPWTDDVA